MSDTSDFLAVLQENETAVADAVPALLADRTTAVRALLALGVKLKFGPLGGAIAERVVDRVQTWLREHSATQRLLMEERKIDAQAQLARAQEEFLQALSQAIAAEVAAAESLQHHQTRSLIVDRGCQVFCV